MNSHNNKKKKTGFLATLLLSFAFLLVTLFPANSFAQMTICFRFLPDGTPCPTTTYQGGQEYEGVQYQGGGIYTPGSGYQYTTGRTDTKDATIITDHTVADDPVYNNASVGIFCPKIANYNTVMPLVRFVTCIIQAYIIPIAFTLAVILFFYGSASFILNLGNEEARAKAKKYLIWGVLMIFVIVSIWGVVAILSNFFGFQTVIPQLQ